eukprot:scaffold4671_cov45-Phaeocystis_antarctica.AAC.2
MGCAESRGLPSYQSSATRTRASGSGALSRAALVKRNQRPSFDSHRRRKPPPPPPLAPPPAAEGVAC